MNGSKYGLLGGFLATLYLTILYVSNPSLLVSGWKFGIWVIFMAAMALATVRERQDLGGEIDFKEAIRQAFLALTVANFVSVIFVALLFGFIDPSLVDILKKAKIQFFTENYKDVMPDDKFSLSIRDLETQDYSPTFIAMLFEFCFNSIIGFILAAGISAMVRKSSDH